MMKSSHSHLNLTPVRQWAVLLAVVGGIVVNGISNFFPPQGMNVGQIANTLFAPVLVIPANYAFAIWGLIYIGLIAFAVYQFQPSQRNDPRLERSGWLLVMASIAQMAWIYLFEMRLFLWSVIAMLAILLPLAGMYIQLKGNSPPHTRWERWAVQYPISLYLGWISVATVVNVASWLYSANWNGGGIAPAAWTIVMMIVSAAIALVALQRHSDPIFPLVIIWALVAIAVRQWSVPWVAGAALVIALLLALILVYQGRQRSLWH